jgi:hypothetical protein
MDTNTLIALIRLDNTLEEFGHDIKRLKEQFAELDTKRKPLSDEELKTIAVEEEFLLFCSEDEFVEIARAIEKAHGIGQ